MRGSLALHALSGAMRCAGCGRSGTRLCSMCGALDPGGFGDVIWAWPYGGAARSLVLATKVRGERVAAESLGDGVWRACVRNGVVADAIAWVPGRSADTRQRGFDHAHAIASRVSRRYGIPLKPLLVRAIANPDQTSLGGDERRRNLEGVFVAENAAPSCVVIDDVVTTGATAGACIQALMAAGTRRIVFAAACGPRG